MMFFVTGAAGSGKTTCLAGLRAALPDMDWRDFDEGGVPDPCNRGWRPRTTESWMQLALANQSRSVDTGIAGGAVMGEILACPSAPRIAGIHVALLDCQDIVRLDRIRKRGTPQWATQEMLSWAAWQRVHAVDPQWRQDVICNTAFPEMCWERWTEWQRGDPRWEVPIIDTSTISVDETVARLVALVEAKRQQA